MRSVRYQYSLIVLGLLSTALLGVFFYYELFPEYRIYQNAYVELEKFRSTYTGEAPPEFQKGVKQIVLERDDRGPALIDRCVSCHVALKFEHFSPTIVARDVNGKIMKDAGGYPLKIPNPNDVWTHLNAKIEALLDPKTLLALEKEGNLTEIKRREKDATHLKSLKTAQVGEHIYDMTKVLAMHPLMGKETRPFEFHPLEDYGCVVCHSGNGRGLTTLKAHGPVYDGYYEIEEEGFKPQFLEKDPLNDPPFASVFNSKPGHALLFQTTPLYVGALIESNCVQCHQNSKDAAERIEVIKENFENTTLNQVSELEKAFHEEQNAAKSTALLYALVEKSDVDSTLSLLSEKIKNDPLTKEEIKELKSQQEFLKIAVGGADGLRPENKQAARDVVLEKLKKQLIYYLGSENQFQAFEELLKNGIEPFAALEKVKNDKRDAAGSLTVKQRFLEASKHASLGLTLSKETSHQRNSQQIDLLTRHYELGKQLFFSQACYACHRIAGLSRGGIGPELTFEGLAYPWFIKESIVWPQADLRSSTMPNFRLDHMEVENLMTFLLAQRGQPKTSSIMDRKHELRDWEGGKRLLWEQPVPSSKIKNLNYGMEVFALEGCAACHRLIGYESNIGYAAQKEKPIESKDLKKVRAWFRHTIPEDIDGAGLVSALEINNQEFKKVIAENVRKESILEAIDEKQPGILISFYPPFQYALRAHNKAFKERLMRALGSEREKILQDQKAWRELVQKVLKIFIQEYGLGRVIGPRPSWSGVYRSDQWLMQHFRNPSALVSRSIMPTFPFDDSKFYALTYMLDVLGQKNREALQLEWKENGFSPPLIYNLLCSQCHGLQRQGNGPVAEWIYPVPKSLQSAEFMRYLTKERAIDSIIHGVPGTPMAPWGEIATDKMVETSGAILSQDEIEQLVNWLFAQLSGEILIPNDENLQKWHYTPEDVLKDLNQEGNSLKLFKVPQAKAPLRGTSTFWNLPSLFASASLSQSTQKLSDLFDIRKDSGIGIDSTGYYIKQKFYTPENIAAGERFFQINCAVCHGRDGDGAGARAGSMQVAKPRMFTNLNWLNERDDLRLIRSIKYGVSGTSMTPWGDLTNGLQRVQLVIYIRHITEMALLSKTLADAIYKAFDDPILRLETLRGKVAMDEIEDKLSLLRNKREELDLSLREGKVFDAKLATDLYAEEARFIEKLKKAKDQDKEYEEYKKVWMERKKYFQELGEEIIRTNALEIWHFYLELLNLEANEAFHSAIKETEEEKYFYDQMELALKALLKQQQQKKTQLLGLISSPERKQALGQLEEEKERTQKLLQTVQMTQRMDRELKEKGHKLYKKIEKEPLEP